MGEELASVPQCMNSLLKNRTEAGGWGEGGSALGPGSAASKTVLARSPAQPSQRLLLLEAHVDQLGPHRTGSVTDSTGGKEMFYFCS